jgi:hypothetical protein
MSMVRVRCYSSCLLLASRREPAFAVGGSQEVLSRERRPMPDRGSTPSTTPSCAAAVRRRSDGLAHDVAAALTAMWSARPHDPKQWLADFLTAQSNQRKTKPMVYVIYYSMHGHVRKLVRPLCSKDCARRSACCPRLGFGEAPRRTRAQAEQEQIGVEKAGCDCKVFQVPETLPADGPSLR